MSDANGRAVVMLVEDDPDIRAITMLALMLDPTLEIMEVGCGRDAMRRLERAPPPDLMLIDNQLPDMDGVSLAEAVGRRVSPTPLIAFITASVRADDQRRYRDVGAVAVIAKPFDPLCLAKQVRALLNR
ncbi:response regulator [Sphingomonas sp. RHCKR7]|uniref:response regulator n=1 Tax=Sphingomonas folli TaxID=2862497 RepID=UPI001CA4A95C|nr:response regulator [Sphingomonas folli]MBW6528525.1 response regulator [Sphingomonas folli]